MKTRLTTTIWASVAALSLSTAAVPALEFSGDAVRAACSIGATECQAAINAAIAQIRAAGLSPDALNAELGALAATVAEGASSAPPGELAGISQAVTSIANEVDTSGSQSTQLSNALNGLQDDITNDDLDDYGPGGSGAGGLIGSLN